MSCGNGGSSDKTIGKKIFRYNESAGITSLDPAFSRNIENIWACNQLYNGLVQMDDNLNIIPCIANRWEI
ncbi:MAG TPA: ABC transporter substrate-binding protein, partial [Vicingus sp.]|nr:ABC transporter substrate-binding protein [Vicingus sp.]